MPFFLQVPRPIYEAMIAQALAERPNECCGLLAGQRAATAVVSERYRLVNALASPIEYESEPRGMFEAERDMRRRGLEILAVYHSHPTSPPIPSRKDRERSYSAEVVNLIISLAEDEPAVRGWWIDAEGHTEAEWACVPPLLPRGHRKR
jgi:[CysO sulfur-carrier protein]-S-L-cysteine hydrolase